MAATFTIGVSTATFHALVQGSRQTAGDVQQLTLGVYLDDPLVWPILLAMVTTKYHVHAPFAGEPVLDIVRGPGPGTLTVDELGTGTAILIDLSRDRYLLYGQTMGMAGFLITEGTF